MQSNIKLLNKSKVCESCFCVGAVGLTEDSAELLRWMTCARKSRYINEFETSLTCNNDDECEEENEDANSEQNPDLLVLDTYDIKDKDVANTVNSIETLGKTQFQEFKKSAKHQSQVAMLKKNCQLFSQLYVACHFRDGNLDEFFSHENQTFPPSLSKDGMLHTGYKSDLLCSLDDIQDTSQDKPSVKCIAIDGTAVANILAPVNCINFKDYSKKVSPPFILQQFQSGCRRVDIVWDVYLENSLKESARIKGGQGVRRRVLQDSTIPSNWHAFHLVDQN